MPFAPGVSGNPKGRPRNVGATGKLRVAIEKQAPEIIAALVESALAGDTQAASVLLSRILPPRKPTDEPLPALTLASLEDAPQAVLEALGRGALSADQATAISQLVSALARAKEVSELESRITALEQHHANRA